MRIILLLLLVGCSSVPRDHYWPIDCKAWEYTDECLEAWEMNKYGSLCEGSKQEIQECINNR